MRCRRCVRYGSGHVGVGSLKSCASGVSSGTEKVGCTEPYLVLMVKEDGSGRARFCAACNFAEVAAAVRDVSHFNR